MVRGNLPDRKQKTKLDTAKPLGAAKGWTPRREITIVIPITIVIITYGRQLGGSMGYTTIIWDMDDDPDGNVQHIAQHDLTKEEVEDALAEPEGRSTSRSSGLPIIFGTTSTGRFITVVFQEIDNETIKPVTAFDIDE